MASATDPAPDGISGPSTLVPPSIAPVPPEQGTLSALDIGVLWNDLSLGLLVLVTGALLVPALGLPAAIAAIVVGSLIGVRAAGRGGPSPGRANDSPAWSCSARSWGEAAPTSPPS